MSIKPLQDVHIVCFFAVCYLPHFMPNTLYTTVYHNYIVYEMTQNKNHEKTLMMMMNKG